MENEGCLTKLINPDIPVRIDDLDNGGNSVLKCINPSDYRRTLGYNLNATNDNTELTKVLVAKATNITRHCTDPD